MKWCGIDLHIEGVARLCQSLGFKKHCRIAVRQQSFDG